MSALTSEQWQSRDNVPSSEATDMKNDNATDFAKFIEAQSPITGSTGAREMLKAGQRRLRQLAQRQRKNTDPKTKAEESARQLLALQEGGFLPSVVPVPPSAPKRSGHKKSLDSSRSSSRSISNLSFKSNSRRDVESIGQPWLTDPLEKERQEIRANHLSALNLRELTSLVEAAVSLPPRFDDANPPPYQPPTPAKDVKVDMQGVNRNPTTAADAANNTPESENQQSSQPKNLADTNMRVQVEHCGEQESDVMPLDSIHKDQAGLVSDADAKRTGLRLDSEAANKPPSSSSSGSLSTPTSQTTLSLKLFPNPIPPRNPSRGAWRISNARPLALNRPLPAAPSTDLNTEYSQPADSVSLQEDRVTQKVSDTIRSASFDAGKSGKEPMASPVGEKFPQKKGCRRPSSLPMCTIDAFPLPAPMRPLPSLPESTSAVDINDRNSSGKSTPLPRLVLDGKSSAASTQDESAKLGKSAMSNSAPPVRIGQSRVERVHALKMRDMSASRLYLRDSETPQEAEEDQPSKSAKSPQEAMSQERGEAPPPRPETEKPTGRNKRYQRKVSADPPSPPPVSPPPSNPSRHLISQSIGRRYCTTPINCGAASARETGPPLVPVSNTGAPIRRSGSTRSVASSQGRGTKEQSSVSYPDMPIPSSDDECTSASVHQDRARPPSGKRRRMRPAPLTLTEPASHKVRATKNSSSDHGYPFTPRGYRTRLSERSSPRSHLSHSTYHSQDSRSSHRQSSHVIRSLEERIAHLERQNKVLQAALLAALDVGVKDNLESVLGGSATSLSTSATTPATGSSFSSTTHSSSLDESMAEDRRHTRRKQPPYRPTSWIASPESSRRGSYDTDDSDNVRELEDMIEDMDFDWMSDKSDAARS
ncbi:hypothetical protein BO94DRAFT_545278 [Aspergillus sclerotioniger CBS 115572]|uniref:Uncharacterized protein n=1 Tax=Aspergillus sclerotioniger CBS 115572 TaxID=1450535 RepID=A0A317WZ59_9EURO|nr:hypothetical protein BO94DRAFT_545278 [Aspergillus sclerotioniger CBS 115572]PWY90547.1 hypothetical protein BO94DRAFT_545278 [Aspergillus sclerotioniger CBS 115572]